jgi:hypothetical protein
MDIVYPFAVHWGLLYINEDCGPITDLLCAVNIIPIITSMHPRTRNIQIKICIYDVHGDHYNYYCYNVFLADWWQIILRELSTKGTKITNLNI